MKILMKMSLLSFALCIFFSMIILTSVIFIFLIFSNLLRNSHFKIDKQMFKKRFSSFDQNFLRSDLNPNIFSNRYPNVSKEFLEFFHKNRLISKLRRSESDLSKYLMFRKEYQNIYGVKFRGKKNSMVPNINMLCDIPFNFLIKSFNTDLYSDFDVLYLNKILKINQKGGQRVNCAIVSNSGSLIGSNLGQEIDSHDIVMRFNNAPTLTYEEDVGKKTSIRLLNSQLLSDNNFNISSSDLYRDNIKFVWDASDYYSHFNQWFNKSHHFFKSYERIIELFPKKTFFILDPKLIWKSWDILQSTTTTTIPKNPPTSGFLGIIILLKICSKLDIYEYIPSIRITDKCHYYDKQIDRGCTFGHWHPLSTEKLYIVSINEGKEIASKGKISLMGCPQQ